jgi:hypothetical protein
VRGRGHSTKTDPASSRLALQGTQEVTVPVSQARRSYYAQRDSEHPIPVTVDRLQGCPGLQGLDPRFEAGAGGRLVALAQ